MSTGRSGAGARGTTATHSAVVAARGDPRTCTTTKSHTSTSRNATVTAAAMTSSGCAARAGGRASSSSGRRPRCHATRARRHRPSREGLQTLCGRAFCDPMVSTGGDDIATQHYRRDVASTPTPRHPKINQSINHLVSQSSYQSRLYRCHSRPTRAQSPRGRRP